MAGMRDSLNPINHKGDVLSLSKQHNSHEGKSKGSSFVYFVSFVFKISSPENIWAFVLFLIVIALIIFTSDSSPAWIYQGF